MPRSALATQLKLSPTDLRFGKVIVGQVRSLSATVTNTSAKAVRISSIRSSTSRVFLVRNPKLPLTLESGHHLELQVGFRPLETGYVTGRILVDTSAVSLELHGRGESALKANPPSLTFGSVRVGESAKLPIALTNAGTSPITISDGRVPGAGFTIVGFHSPLTLEPKRSYRFFIEFSPQRDGRVSSELKFTDRGEAAVAIPLHGTGTAAGQLRDAPGAMNFGTVTVGTSESRSGTLTAAERSVTVRSVTSNSSEFVVTGISFPVTIAAGHSVHYTVKFTPRQSGTASAALSFASNASDSKVSESLTGSGVQAKQSVALSWKASTSKVMGYNVYRGDRSGGPYVRINQSVNPGTTYTDASVAPGQIYYYVIASVNSKGQQSKYSNQAEAAIP
jgi:Abnormal spindle-like microcephaly-assoc'd, ASPM-SPD-2-Hydin